MDADRNLGMICGVTLMAVIGVSMITPAFPSIRDALFLSNAQVGYLVTAFTLPGVVFSFFIGALSDRIGTRAIVVVSLFAFGVLGALVPFSPSFEGMLVLRFFQGCAASGLSTLSLAMIGEYYQGESRAVAMGYNGSVLSIGTASYPFIGGLLASAGWKYPFYTFAVAIPLGFVMLLFMEPSASGTRISMHGATYRSLLSLRSLMLLATTVVTFILLYGSYLTYYTLYLDDFFSASSTQIGIILSIMSISTAVVSSQTGSILRGLGAKRAMMVGFCCYSAALLLMFFQPSMWSGIAAVVMFGIGQGCNLPLLQTSILDSAPEELRGLMSAIYSSALRVGQSIGPVLMGVLYTLGGFGLVFMASAALAACTAMALFLQMNTGSACKHEGE